MIQDGRQDGSALEESQLPRGEPWSPPRRALGARTRVLPRGTLVVGLALAAAVGALLFARRDSLSRTRDRLRLLPRTVHLPERRVRHGAKVRGFWAGVLASAGSAVAGTVARRLAEDLFETARNERAAEKVAQG